MKKIVLLIAFLFALASSAMASNSEDVERENLEFEKNRKANTQKFVNSAKIIDAKFTEMDIVQMWVEFKEINRALFLVMEWAQKEKRGKIEVWPVDLPKFNKILDNRARWLPTVDSEDPDVILLHRFVQQQALAAKEYMYHYNYEKYDSFLLLNDLGSPLRYVAERIQKKYGRGKKIIPPED